MSSDPERPDKIEYAQLIDFARSFSAATDMISCDLVDHNMLVASVAGRVARELGASANTIESVLLAGMLHDIGAVANEVGLDQLSFDHLPLDDGHPERGYQLLKSVEPLGEVARLVRYHHQAWDDGRGAEDGGQRIPEASHVVQLADHVAMAVNPRQAALEQANRICKFIRSQAGTRLHPRQVEAFLDLAARPDFWREHVTRARDQVAVEDGTTAVMLDRKLTLSLAGTFSQIIDLRSNYTATHGLGVATIVGLLGELMGLSPEQRDDLSIAGHLHDLGKIAIPRVILEKPGALDDQEFEIIRTHSFITYRILKELVGFQEISIWAVQHHERLDGRGYPFHLKGSEIQLGSRILSIADVYTALTEDRPYRVGMPSRRALALIEGMASKGAMDADVVASLGKHLDHIEDERHRAQDQAARRLAQLRWPGYTWPQFR